MITVLTLLGCGAGEPIAVEGPGDTDPETTLPYVGGFAEGGFCDVQTVFQVGCIIGCHSGLVPEAGLDLETDPYGALVGAYGESGKVLIDPGQPANSFLLAKMEGDLAPTDGEIMPPASGYGQLMAPVVEQWIRDGAPSDCGGFVEPGTPTDYTEEDPYHPPGWTAPDQHGLAANLQTDGDCRSCHGAQLDGGSSGVSCDTCHDLGWRNDCTFCHGGTENATGAPPEDIDNNTVGISFPEHGEHVAGYDHKAYSCYECHPDRSDVLDPGHVFDDLTAGYGELYYGTGISQYATYLFGSCDNVYCHGSGLADDGSVTVGETMYCYSCHPDITTPDEWQDMSDRHDNHLANGDIYCADCHSVTVDAAQVVIGPQYHVDGAVDVLPVGIGWDGQSCDGSCHNHNHNNSEWD